METSTEQSLLNVYRSILHSTMFERPYYTFCTEFNFYKSSPDFTPCKQLDIKVMNHEIMISKVHWVHFFFLFSVTLLVCT